MQLPFTVITLCRCGCDNPAEVQHVDAPKTEEARAKAIENFKPDKRDDIDVVCVLKGHCELAQ